MEHSSHAHPLPDERHDSNNGSSASSYASCTIASPPTPTPQNRDEYLNQQTRRLQLRNTGFRGPMLPFRRISPLLGASANGIEPFTRPVNHDNSPSSAEKRSLYGENLPDSPVNILQEIHKVSASKRRTTPKGGLGAIFEDDSAKENASETSWYEGGSNDCSPVARVVTPAKMTHLREMSLNQKTPPPSSSPLVKHVKSHPHGRSKFRSVSSETARYVEHLESELAAAHAKLDMQPSPRTSKNRATKLRTLTTENRSLKHENSEWQKSFEIKVQEERAKLLTVDMELKNGMRMLEYDIEMKDARMAELEWELESMRVRVRDLEGLEAINQNLEKRIEALTNLLVQSPSKLELSSASTSPIRTDPFKRTPRPRSMFPRLPPSPGGSRTPLATVSETCLTRSQSLGSYPDYPQSPEETKQEFIEDDVSSPTGDKGITSPTSTRHSGFTDSRPRTSSSLRSAPSSASRPTSLQSNCSFGPVSWGLPDHESRSTSKQRRMRRFPSGSNSLKPLILSKAVDPASLAVSTPGFQSLDGTVKRDVSDISDDPTTAFLSRLEDSVPSGQQKRQRSTSWTQEQTLKALEGRFEDEDDLDENDAQGQQTLLNKNEEPTIESEIDSQGKRRRLSRPRSLQKELEEAEINTSAECQTDAHHLDIYEDGLIPVKSDQIWESPDPTPSKAPLPTGQRQQRRQALDTDTTPRPPHNQLPLMHATTRSVKGLPSTSLTDEHARGVFTRLTDIITKTKQDPFILARRLLANAWSLGSKQLGGIGWWLLGLVYGTRWRKRRRKADINTADDGSTTNSGWPHFSNNASGNRSAEPYSRDHGSTRTQRASWLSPPHVPCSVSPSARSQHSWSEPHLFPCDGCVEPSSRRTLRLWLRFSLTIVLAVGMAVKHGPGTLLANDDQLNEMPISARAPEREPLLREHRRKNQVHQSFAHSSDVISSQSQDSHDTNGVDSGYGSVTFAESLGRTDYRNR